MNKLLTKKNVLILSLFGTIFFLSPVIFYGIFDCYEHNIFLCSGEYQHIVRLFVPFFYVFIFSLIFSLITYKMKQGVFDYWMKFAIWAAPMLMILTFLILGGGNNGLGVEGAIGGGFDAMIFMILYGAFIGISIYRIVSKHRHLKRGK